MKIEFDRQADALYIQFQPGKSKRSVKVQDGVIVDIAKDGRIFGLEILDASRRIPLAQLARVDLNLPAAKAS
ncbi:MAG: hypothetical protein A3C35_00570 [Omnitrophica bacterium RIFCSPHIGHO2_02_FULL_46_11]|nr:MAG: hypothetical protein A3C35_00570 [Omnitrophica bacterium RIFCSPHIGHO2_02_FULL_46_11]